MKKLVCGIFAAVAVLVAQSAFADWSRHDELNFINDSAKSWHVLTIINTNRTSGKYAVVGEIYKTGSISPQAVSQPILKFYRRSNEVCWIWKSPDECGNFISSFAVVLQRDDDASQLCQFSVKQSSGVIEVRNLNGHCHFEHYRLEDAHMFGAGSVMKLKLHI